MPKTLAKTLSYILYHAPGQHGLFWDADGTMPWKELYGALQEDPFLRFVRQSHFHELDYLEIEMSAKLQGNILLLQEGFPLPDYPVSEQIPNRLFHACPRKRLEAARTRGLLPSNRPCLAVAADRDLALRLGRRKDPQPMVVEIDTSKARAAGIAFRSAGSGLFLVESLPVECLRLPPVREDRLVKLSNKKREKAAVRPESTSSPGSYLASVDHFRAAVGGGAEASSAGEKAKDKRGKKGPEWKRDARKGKDRLKRSV